MAIRKPFNMQVRELTEFTQGLMDVYKAKAKEYPALYLDGYVESLEKFTTLKVKLDISMNGVAPVLIEDMPTGHVEAKPDAEAVAEFEW